MRVPSANGDPSVAGIVGAWWQGSDRQASRPETLQGGEGRAREEKGPLERDGVTSRGAPGST